MSGGKKFPYVSQYNRKDPNIQKWPTEEETKTSQVTIGGEYSAAERRMLVDLVHDAAKAEEHYSADELEEFAAKLRDDACKDGVEFPVDANVTKKWKDDDRGD